MLYGALLNKHFRFYDDRLGESTTGTGRAILKFQCSKVNELLTGVYDPLGDAVLYGDTDSFVGVTVVNTSLGNLTVEELFNSADRVVEQPGTTKQYALFDDIVQALSYNPNANQAEMVDVTWVYRHKTPKTLFEVEDERGNTITITGDHSLMVERDGRLLEIRPTELNVETDLLITIN